MRGNTCVTLLNPWLKPFEDGAADEFAQEAGIGNIELVDFGVRWGRTIAGKRVGGWP